MSRMVFNLPLNVLWSYFEAPVFRRTSHADGDTSTAIRHLS